MTWLTEFKHKYPPWILVEWATAVKSWFSTRTPGTTACRASLFLQQSALSVNKCGPHDI